MTNRELLDVIGAKDTKRPGKRRQIRTTDPRTKRFVQKHQELLRRCFRDPQATVNVRDLLAHTTEVGSLFELGFVHIDDVNTGEPRWTHRFGDDHGVRIIIGLIDGAAEHTDVEAHANTLNDAIRSGRARLRD